jgi:ABC-type polysaccharide/polyol phosphate transport system ATPase subunit
MVIKVENLTKTFRIPHERRDTLKEYLFNMLTPCDYEEFNAVSNLSFEVNAGEFVGIIGSNGAGKSTLLKLISGVLPPDSGEVKVVGRIAPFLELGVGFEPELSGRDNIYLYGTLLGLTRGEIESRYDDILRFSSLERFVDQKMKNYSSGMQMRLGFAVTAHVDADIFLIDEVLAVGDAEFQKKCLDKMNELKSQHKTIVFISHNLNLVKKECDRIAWLMGGKIKVGNTNEEIVRAYLGSV